MADFERVANAENLSIIVVGNGGHFMELSRTSLLMESGKYDERFIAEYYQVFIRLDKLQKAIEQYRNGDIDLPCKIELYEEQAKIMSDYLSVLLRRSVIEGINLVIDDDPDLNVDF